MRALQGLYSDSHFFTAGPPFAYVRAATIGWLDWSCIPANGIPMKRGRPRKLPEDRLSVALDFRVTPEEADLVHRAALREKKSVTKFLRDKLRQVFGARPLHG